MKPIKLQQILVCSAIALTLPAHAATNPSGSTPPFNGATTTPTSGDLGGATPPFNGNTNPATSGGQGSMTGGNADATGGLTNPSGAGTTTNAPNPVANESIKEAVADCPLEAYREEAFEEAIRISQIVPDIDVIFNPMNEASAGCFAASSKVINLAMEIPSVSFSLTGIGDLVKKNLERMLMQKAEEVLNKGCAIADQALLGALDPLQKYFDEYSTRVGDFNGMIGNLELGAEYEGSGKGMYSNASDLVAGMMAGTKADIDAGAKAMAAVDAAILEKYRAELQQTPIVGGGSNGSGGVPVPAIANTTQPQARTFGFDDGSAVNNNTAPAASQPTVAAPVPVPRPTAPVAAPANNTSSTNPFSAGNKPTTGNPF